MFFDLSSTSIEEIKSKYGLKLYVDEEFWERKKDSKYATIILIDKLESFAIHKKGMQTWIKLESY